LSDYLKHHHQHSTAIFFSTKSSSLCLIDHCKLYICYHVQASSTSCGVAVAVESWRSLTHTPLHFRSTSTAYLLTKLGLWLLESSSQPCYTLSFSSLYLFKWMRASLSEFVDCGHASAHSHFCILTHGDTWQDGHSHNMSHAFLQISTSSSHGESWYCGDGGGVWHAFTEIVHDDQMTTSSRFSCTFAPLQ
jgi:hypothetical protein